MVAYHDECHCTAHFQMLYFMFCESDLNTIDIHTSIITPIKVVNIQ